jgi:hypothetical protein
MPSQSAEADEITAPPPISLESEQGRDLGLVAVGLEDERQTDVLRHWEEPTEPVRRV